jgi:hypothetical protein
MENTGWSQGRGTGETFMSVSLSPVSSVPVVGPSESSETELTEETESHWTVSLCTIPRLFPGIRRLRAPRAKTDPMSLTTLPDDPPSVDSVGDFCRGERRREEDFLMGAEMRVLSLAERLVRLRELILHFEGLELAAGACSGLVR